MRLQAWLPCGQNWTWAEPRGAVLPDKSARAIPGSLRLSHTAWDRLLSFWFGDSFIVAAYLLPSAFIFMHQWGLPCSFISTGNLQPFLLNSLTVIAQSSTRHSTMVRKPRFARSALLCQVVIFVRLQVLPSRPHSFQPSPVSSSPSPTLWDANNSASYSCLHQSMVF